MRILVHDYAGHPFEIELSRALAEKGHVVSHLYFAGDLGPKGEFALTSVSGLTIQSVNISFPYSKKKMLQRRRGDVEYGRLVAGHIQAFGPDLVMSANTPLEAQAFIQRASRRAGAAFVFWMQDFYSLAVERILGHRWSGLGRVVSKYYRNLEKRQLASSDAIVLISDDFLSGLKDLGVKHDRVQIIPNWAPIDELPLQPKQNPLAAELGLQDRFVFLYSGTLALKHDPNLLWALSSEFKNDPEVLIAVAATGVGVEALKARAREMRRNNIRFLPLQPMNRFCELLGSADIMLAVLEADAGAFSVPSKVLSYLCSGRPIVLSAPPENLATRIIQSARAGLCTKPGDFRAFCFAARQLYADSKQSRSLGQNGRKYAEDNFRIKSTCDRFEDVFKRALGRRRASAP